MRQILFAAFLTACSLAPAFAQSEEDVMARIESLHGDSEEFGEIFGQLQDIFLFGDPSDIAELGLYPILVNANGESYDIFEAEDLVDNFDALVRSETVEALASQDFADLIVTSEGVGFANGALWMTLVCQNDDCADTRWGIITINN